MSVQSASLIQRKYEPAASENASLLTREDKFAALIQRGLLNERDELVFVPAGTSAFVTDDFGLLINGIRYAGPVEAAKAFGIDDETECWKSWRLGEKTLKQVMLR